MKLFTKLYVFALIVMVCAIGFGCQPAADKPIANSGSNGEKPVVKVNVGGAKSPTEAYTMLFTAVKAGDIESIRQMMSKSSIGMAESAAQRQNQAVDQVLKNGFTATTFSDTIPEIRDQRIKENYASVEVRNEKENRWEDLPFTLEDGGWKLAVGDLFSGTFPSKEIGPSKAVRDQIAANKSLPNAGMIQSGNSNSNTAKINVIKPPMPEGMKPPAPAGK